MSDADESDDACAFEDCSAAILGLDRASLSVAAGVAVKRDGERVSPSATGERWKSLSTYKLAGPPVL